MEEEWSKKYKEEREKQMILRSDTLVTTDAVEQKIFSKLNLKNSVDLENTYISLKLVLDCLDELKIEASELARKGIKL